MGPIRVFERGFLYKNELLLTFFRDLIVECLDDRDDSIRLRALDLISGMVSKKNLMEIVRKLMSHMDTSESASTFSSPVSAVVLAVSMLLSVSICVRLS